MPRILRQLLIILLLYSAASAIVGIVVMEAALHPARRSLTESDENAMLQIANVFHARLQDVSTFSTDGVQLNAWSIQPQNGNGNAVLLLHGLGDNRFGMAGYAELFLNHGYSVLMPDARAHGNSGGSLATYGYLERNDIAQWFGWLAFNRHSHCIYGLGESMGAAQLLQALAGERDFCAVIAESTFSTFREISYDRIGQFFHTGPWLGRTVLRPTVEFAFLYARMKYRMNPSAISPEDAVATTHVPVFLIHGLIDSNIPERHSRLILARNRDNIVLWEVPNANHCGAISISPRSFESKVIAWTENHESHPGSFSTKYQR
jgi:pimeloyl-ACP methyl ester carboxylesterase